LMPITLKTVRPGYRFIELYRGEYAVWEVVNQSSKERWKCCIAATSSMETDVGATQTFTYEQIADAKKYGV